MKLVPFGVMVAVGYVAGAKKNSVGGGRAITLASGCFGVEVLQAGVRCGDRPSIGWRHQVDFFGESCCGATDLTEGVVYR